MQILKPLMLLSEQLMITGFQVLMRHIRLRKNIHCVSALHNGYSVRNYFFLNPYREVIAPQIIRYGNPELDAEVANLFEVGYGTYGTDFSINASVYAG